MTSAVGAPEVAATGQRFTAVSEASVTAGESFQTAPPRKRATSEIRTASIAQRVKLPLLTTSLHDESLPLLLPTAPVPSR